MKLILIKDALCHPEFDAFRTAVPHNARDFVHAESGSRRIREISPTWEASVRAADRHPLQRYEGLPNSRCETLSQPPHLEPDERGLSSLARGMPV